MNELEEAFNGFEKYLDSKVWEIASELPDGLEEILIVMEKMILNLDERLREVPNKVEIWKKQHKAEEMTNNALSGAMKAGSEIITINDKLSIGFCQTCKNLIIEGDEYMMYDEDVYLCEKCK